MSIKVIAKHSVKPEKLDEFIKLSNQLVEATNKEDFGCIHYQFYQDVNDPNVTAMIEEWESQEAVETHLKAKHFVDVVPAMRDCLNGPTEVNVYKQLS